VSASPAGRSLRDLAATEQADDGPVLAGHVVRVVLEDRDPFEVRIDNRDFTRWDRDRERLKLPMADKAPFIFQTFLAWSASLRTGEVDLTFRDFEAVCLEAKDVKQVDARPTQ
jgi:hypothetical protein